MPLTRSLPPQFLLPAWSARQLAGAHAVLQQHQRACKSDDTNKENIRFNWKSNKSPSSSPNNKTTNTNPNSSPELRPNSSTYVRRIYNPRPRPGPAKTSALSLFEELFPEESEAKQRAEERREKLGRLPAFDWKRTTPRDDVKQAAERKKLQEEFKSLPSQTSNGLRVEPQQARYLSEREAEEGERRRRREASVLVLNSGMKTLEESDFFRLGPRGEHIEGWTSGIIKGLFCSHCRSLTWTSANTIYSDSR
jgi:hypothetical protein